MLTVLLLLLIAWLLWTLHQDLQESNERQRSLRGLLNRVVVLLEQNGVEPSTGAEPLSAPISLNSASKADLRRLQGVGAVMADRIIAARPFEHVEQLRKVEGVTEKLYLALSSRIVL